MQKLRQICQQFVIYNIIKVKIIKIVFINQLYNIDVTIIVLENSTFFSKFSVQFVIRRCLITKSVYSSNTLKNIWYNASTAMIPIFCNPSKRKKEKIWQIRAIWPKSFGILLHKYPLICFHIRQFIKTFEQQLATGDNVDLITKIFTTKNIKNKNHIFIHIIIFHIMQIYYLY